MARLFLTYSNKLNPGGTQPYTLCQFEAPDNQRVVISAIEIHPFGSSGATPAIEFDLVTQTSEGVGGNSGSFVINSPGADETPQTTVLYGPFTTEPTGPVTQYPIAMHQQSPNIWRPINAFREAIMIKNARWGLRVLTACSFDIGFCVQLEE